MFFCEHLTPQKFHRIRHKKLSLTKSIMQMHTDNRTSFPYQRKWDGFGLIPIPNDNEEKR
jgi:hypothetical protein